MARKQLNIRLDDLTLAAIKRIAAEHNMSESQVVTRGVFLLEQELKQDEQRGRQKPQVDEDEHPMS
jgi:hypothetical protein